MNKRHCLDMTLFILHLVSMEPLHWNPWHKSKAKCVIIIWKANVLTCHSLLNTGVTIDSVYCVLSCSDWVLGSGLWHTATLCPVWMTPSTCLSIGLSSASITSEGFDFPDNCLPFSPLSNSWRASLPAKKNTESHQIKKKTELHGLSPRANYTDRITAACRRSDFQLFADRGCHVVSVTDPYGRILGFLERRRYFSIK
jgi:hypothetical protein